MTAITLDGERIRLFGRVQSSRPGIRSIANRITGNHQLHPAILLPAFRRVIGRDRLAFAEAAGRDGVGRDPLRERCPGEWTRLATVDSIGLWRLASPPANAEIK